MSVFWFLNLFFSRVAHFRSSKRLKFCIRKDMSVFWFFNLFFRWVGIVWGGRLLFLLFFEPLSHTTFGSQLKHPHHWSYHRFNLFLLNLNAIVDLLNEWVLYWPYDLGAFVSLLDDSSGINLEDKLLFESVKKQKLEKLANHHRNLFVDSFYVLQNFAKIFKREEVVTHTDELRVFNLIWWLQAFSEIFEIILWKIVAFFLFPSGLLYQLGRLRLS